MHISKGWKDAGSRQGNECKKQQHVFIYQLQKLLNAKRMLHLLSFKNAVESIIVETQGKIGDQAQLKVFSKSMDAVDNLLLAAFGLCRFE